MYICIAMKTEELQMGSSTRTVK